MISLIQVMFGSGMHSRFDSCIELVVYAREVCEVIYMILIADIIAQVATGMTQKNPLHQSGFKDE